MTKYYAVMTGQMMRELPERPLIPVDLNETAKGAGAIAQAFGAKPTYILRSPSEDSFRIQFPTLEKLEAFCEAHKWIPTVVKSGGG